MSDTGWMDVLNDNLGKLLLLAAAGLIAVAVLDVDVSIPPTSGLLVFGLVVAALAGWAVAVLVHRLLPDEPRVYYVEIRGEDPDRFRLWQLTPDAHGNVTVTQGTLNQVARSIWPVYEVREFDADAMEATATWRESRPDSELVGESDVSDALDAIAELRGRNEKWARWGLAVRRRIGSIIRELDAQRAIDQNRALEEHTAPGLDGAPVEETLQDHLGDLLPEHLQTDESDERRPTDGQFASDAPGDVDGLGGVVMPEEDPLATDGGSDP